MAKIDFKQVVFLKSATQPAHYPILRGAGSQPLLEVAVAGRSNVGKSSLLNHLFLRKNLVKTSATPGKTRTLQFFCVDEKLLLVDLPGYGYAAVPKAVSKEWAEMIENYFKERTSLKLTLLLLDIRRIPNEDDFRFLEWATYQGSLIILVITKADKVNASQRAHFANRILAALQRDLPFVLYSTTKNLGRDQLIGLIQHSLEE